MELTVYIEIKNNLNWIKTCYVVTYNAYIMVNKRSTAAHGNTFNKQDIKHMGIIVNYIILDKCILHFTVEESSSALREQESPSDLSLLTTKTCIPYPCDNVLKQLK